MYDSKIIKNNETSPSFGKISERNEESFSSSDNNYLKKKHN